jgi:hypothetical protein
MRDKNGFIGKTDLDLFTVTDSVEDAMEAIMTYVRQEGLPKHVPEAFA